MNNRCLSKRNNGLDLLRIISAFAVVLLHINYTYSSLPIENHIVILEKFIDVTTRFCIPCFVMISGAFILNNKKNRDFRYFYTKTFYKIQIPFLIFLLLRIVDEIFLQIIFKGDIFIPIKLSLKGNISVFWFMFMLAGLYLITPLIIRLKETMSNKAFTYLAWFWLFVSVITQFYSSSEITYSFGNILSFAGYFVVGNIIYEKNKKTKYNFLNLVLAVLLLILAFVMRFYNWNILNYFNFTQFSKLFTPTIVFASILLLKFFMNISVNINVKSLSAKTYYIYLIHSFVYQIIFMIIRKPIINEAISIVIITLATFILSWLGATIYIKVWSILENKFNWKEKWNHLFYK